MQLLYKPFIFYLRQQEVSTKDSLNLKRDCLVRVLSALTFLLLHCGVSAAGKYASDEIIVKFVPATQDGHSLTASALLRDPALSATVKQLNVLQIEQLNNPLGSSDIQNPLRNTFLLRLKSGQNLEKMLQILSADARIVYAQPNHVYRLHAAPNDSLWLDQTSWQIISAESAWDIQTASEDVIVGVIDTGIDYRHKDLHNAIWINDGEDLNGNGQLDDADLNNIDDDGNGFIDDVVGWDFTDAPSFPDGGDFRDRDNDPDDQNGHGTRVAGIIGASGNNTIGIAGLAYGCRVMAVRAGTSLGFLEEDDVASALVYAIDNGARIINMSFGDEVASPLLRDVIHYAHSRNVVLIASAGNSSSDRIHFPSGFAETISVGATTKTDQLANFSNYGSSVDLVAPGQDVLTTSRDNGYDLFSGTSASAPFVSALAALILSQRPHLSNQAIRGLLVSTATDLGQPGWDILFANGRIDAGNALRAPNQTIAQITSPAVGQGFHEGPILIRCTAAGTFLESTQLFLGVGETPESWDELFSEEQRQRFDEEIFSLAIEDLPDGQYTLRLLVNSANVNPVEDKTSFLIDRTPPRISAVRQTDLLDGAQPSFLLEFDTDEVCDATILFRNPADSDFREKKLRFRSSEHRVHFTRDIASGPLQYFLEATNSSGLVTTDDNGGNYYSTELSDLAVGGIPIESQPYTFQPGYLLPKIADFNGDGNLEIVINAYDGNLNFSKMKILEFVQGGFQEIFATNDIFIPRDWGDSDGDGKLEILAGRAATSFIFEAAAPNALPRDVVWQRENTWASRFVDLDSDGKDELILRIDDVFAAWRAIGDNDYDEIQQLPNPTEGSNFVGVPRSVAGDFDGDGKIELLFGDFEGDIYIYEAESANSLLQTWSDRMPLLDAIDYLSTGDYNRDGINEFAVGSHSDPNLNLESNFDSRHWIFRIYSRTADDVYEPVWQQAFWGFQSPSDFDSGVSSGDVDNDGDDELLLTIFPDFYLVDYDSAAEEYDVTWHTEPARSNATLVADFDQNGENEFYFNSGHEFRSFKRLSAFGGPSTPTNFIATVLDSHQIKLSWQFNSSADIFKVYRAIDGAGLAVVDSTNQRNYLDTGVSPKARYSYAVTAVNYRLVPSESQPTTTLEVRPGAKPFLVRAKAQDSLHILLRFSEQMNASIQNQTNYWITQTGYPSSVVVGKSGTEALLTSNAALRPGLHTVRVDRVFDLTQTPIDTTRSSTTFTVKETTAVLYITEVIQTGLSSLRLQFSQPLEIASAENTANYDIEPDIEILSATLAPDDAKAVDLKMARPLQAIGKDYVVTVLNVESQQGAVIQPAVGNTIAVRVKVTDLLNVLVFPNPYRADSGKGLVTVMGLTPGATVRILSVSGRLIRTLREPNGNGGLDWDLNDESGQPVASGIYLFHAVDGQNKAVGKFAVIR